MALTHQVTGVSPMFYLSTIAILHCFFYELMSSCGEYTGMPAALMAPHCSRRQYINSSSVNQYQYDEFGITLLKGYRNRILYLEIVRAEAGC